MTRPATFALGLLLGALAYPAGLFAGALAARRSPIYPH